MPRRGHKSEIIKKDKNIFFKPEKSGRRRGRDRLFLGTEKPSKENAL